MKPKFYMLIDGKIETTDDLIVWGKYMEGKSKIIQQDTIGDVFISTVFLGLDYSYTSDEPILFETMIFPKGFLEKGNPKVEEIEAFKKKYPELYDYCERYSTLEEAQKGHIRAVDLVSSLTK